jgi:pantetheine-phosphate adenylyltransferase
MEKKTVAIFPGSFNPFTIGHLNILEKIEAIFGKENVIVAVGINPEKNPFISGVMAQATNAPHVRTIQQNLPSRNVVGFYGFLTDLVWEKEHKGFNVVVVKGLRNGVDFDHENLQLRYMQDMKPDLKIIYIPCDRHLEHVSSSGYRSLEKIKSGSGYKYLAKEAQNEETD